MHKATIFFIIAIFAFVCAFETNALPIAEDIDLEDGSEREHVRVRRFTCDVLSFEAKGIKVNDAACGAHCLFRGRTGGYCNSKRVCICR